MSPVIMENQDSLYIVRDADGEIAVARKSRLPMQYDNGLAQRRRQLQLEYCLPDGLRCDSDIVIDCGANIGEFSMICAASGATVMAFESDRIEFHALERNSKGKTIEPTQIALWKQSGTLTFYDRNDSGDSSLLNDGTGGSSYEVETVRLDNFSNLPDGDIRLIKLEAEVAEPEILEGMSETLKRTQYVTVDMGPERGPELALTVVECTGFLQDAGFRMIGFHQGRCTGLFERVTY